MKYKFQDVRVFVFTKPPIPGKCKTRLIPYLGEEGAAILQKNLIHSIIVNLSNFQLCPFEIWQSEQNKYFSDLVTKSKNNIEIHTQSGSDLGARMSDAFEKGLKRLSKVIIIGSDCVEYSKDYLTNAIQILDQHEVVIGPAYDGGYVLVGATRFYSEIFEDISWGSGHVFTETIVKLQFNNITYSTLSPLNDIDTEEDLGLANEYVGKPLQNK